LSVKIGQHLLLVSTAFILLLVCASSVAAEMTGVEGVEVQPLVAQVKRVVEAMGYLGEPFSAAENRRLNGLRMRLTRHALSP
jgi:hypothetical protein